MLGGESHRSRETGSRPTKRLVAPQETHGQVSLEPENRKGERSAQWGPWTASAPPPSLLTRSCDHAPPFWPDNPDLEVCEGNNPASPAPGRWRPVVACFPHQHWWRRWRWCRGFSAPKEKAILSAGVRGWVTGRQQGGIQTLSLTLWMPASWSSHSAPLGLSSDSHPEESCPMPQVVLGSSDSHNLPNSDQPGLRSLPFPGGGSAALSLRGQRLGRCWGLFHPQLSPSLTACRW